ncbi:hypothetical protein N7532_011950 [Penicillium argentinense]|uniref:Uncharacterized protein n=1 Tax=Penicillium argentinense TaxID=1131581 RepID=A0A9W9JVR1_9EURO|nr:uncharacterized protein N7532_011950 [Penicillium argentinense]KAJ5082907.1 hypothetical protein N7532_011950 [Penicillium argentinense]
MPDVHESVGSSAVRKSHLVFSAQLPADDALDSSRRAGLSHSDAAVQSSPFSPAHSTNERRALNSTSTERVPLSREFLTWASGTVLSCRPADPNQPFGMQ